MAEEEEQRKKPGVAREYSNDKIAITWEPRYCMHAAFCLMGNPQVFDAMRRPWIDLSDADADADADAIADIVASCPSGALHYRRLDGGEEETAPDDVNVYERPNGPLFLRGKIRVVSQDGKILREDTRVALCRCGYSANKPFCDATHRRVGFRTT